MAPAALAFAQHNHQVCIDTALQRAAEVCLAAGVQLTRQRVAVLQLIWQNHKPLGAYALMAMLEAHTGRRVAPPTVYRALDFLLEQGLIHRVHSLNAFVGCNQPGHQHSGNLLLCRQCGVAQELHGPALPELIRTAASEQAFSVEHLMLEMVGLCAQCREDSSE